MSMKYFFTSSLPAWVLLYGDPVAVVREGLVAFADWG
jgi:hypothetical protein